MSLKTRRVRRLPPRAGRRAWLSPTQMVCLEPPFSRRARTRSDCALNPWKRRRCSNLRSSHADLIFANEVGERRTEFRAAWRRILAKAQITDPAQGINGDLHWHDLRHECGSHLAEEGVALHEIRYLLGHKVLTTTQRYLNVTLDA